MSGLNPTSMDTLRMAGSKMRDYIGIMVQEYTHRGIIDSIFMRMAANESPDRCGKYANAMDYFFGDKRKITDGNPVEIPCVKGCRSFESDNITSDWEKNHLQQYPSEIRQRTRRRPYKRTLPQNQPRQTGDLPNKPVRRIPHVG